jgi:hypothetical protein
MLDSEMPFHHTNLPHCSCWLPSSDFAQVEKSPVVLKGGVGKEDAEHWKKLIESGELASFLVAWA